MLILSSRSATVLVIFVIAIVAFCLASVFGAMTGTINIFPNATDDSSEISNSSISEYKTYGSEYNNDYGSYDDSSHEENNDKQEDSGGLLDSLTGHSNSDSSSVETTSDSGSSSSSSNVETTSDSGSSSSSSNVETTTASGDDTA